MASCTGSIYKPNGQYTFTTTTWHHARAAYTSPTVSTRSLLQHGTTHGQHIQTPRSVHVHYYNMASCTGSIDKPHGQYTFTTTTWHHARAAYTSPTVSTRSLLQHGTTHGQHIQAQRSVHVHYYNMAPHTGSIDKPHGQYMFTTTTWHHARAAYTSPTVSTRSLLQHGTTHGQHRQAPRSVHVHYYNMAPCTGSIDKPHGQYTFTTTTWHHARAAYTSPTVSTRSLLQHGTTHGQHIQAQRSVHVHYYNMAPHTGSIDKPHGQYMFTTTTWHHARAAYTSPTVSTRSLLQHGTTHGQHRQAPRSVHVHYYNMAPCTGSIDKPHGQYTFTTTTWHHARAA
ncbi:hypothetical protein ACJMK2_023675 [Sinanodonta woodiana]|uniref:Uncharacterized protein n=1 Tax=Sinanodonta woodiana TaxID=1069815 RepID=A0ABD3T5U2_SINWO